MIGNGHRRLDGAAKVTGQLRYTGDLHLAGEVHLRPVLSPHAAAGIAGYELDAARAVPGVVAVLTGHDLAGLAGRAAPGPLAQGRVLYQGQPVVAVVAESEAAAADAAALVQVIYEPVEPLVDVFAASAPGARPLLEADGHAADDSDAHGATVKGGGSGSGHPNVAVEVHLEQGSVEAALAASVQVVRGRWSMPRAHQAPLEPHVSIAAPEPLGEMRVWTSTQCPFEVRNETARTLGVRPSQVRVISPPLGGGFGAKAVPLLEPLVAAAAALTGRPVRCELTRTEEFQLVAAIGGVFDLEVGADADGRLLALTVSARYDCGVRRMGGARLGAVLLCGTYQVASYRYDAYDVQTNKAPAFPYRAPSAIGFFALESALDELAGRLGMDPLELRARNASRAGDPHVAGGSWPEFGLAACLEAAKSSPLLASPLGADEAVGVAAGAWGGAAGAATVSCGVDSDGSVAINVGYADLTGASTAYAMIAAEELGLPAGSVRVEVGDTSTVPYSGQAGGSRSTLTLGSGVLAAARAVRRRLLEAAADRLEVAVEDLVLEDGRMHVAGAPSRSLEIGELAAASHQLRSGLAPFHASVSLDIPSDSPMATVHLCRVKVDRETGAWDITGYTAIQDVGRALNPPEAAGQVHGGVLQSVARALGEELAVSADGTLRTATFLDYEMPTIDQAPAIEVQLLEVPSPTGPYGARGAGEPPAIPGSAAVRNALQAATGRRIAALPARPSLFSNGAGT